MRKRIRDGLDYHGWKEGSRCLPGTRLRYLDEILKWCTDFDGSPVCWLTGIAGSGKSSIANEVALQHHETGQIYSCFFFKRDDTTLSASAIQLLAFGLSYHHAALRAAISKAMESLQDLRATPTFSQQFQQFLVTPLQKFCTANADAHITLIMDALDECPSTIRADIMHAIQHGALLLPKNIKIFLTSRPQQDIAVYMQKLASKGLHIKIGLDQDDGDLRHYFKHQLSNIRMHTGLEEVWSDNALARDASALATKACGLFQWAAVACALIKDCFNPSAVIQRILSLQSGSNALDTLYADSLQQAFPKANNDPDFRCVYVQVMGAIITAKEPLATVTIAELIGIDAVHVERLLKNLGCVISVESEQGMQVAHIGHPSFFDFLTNNTRCTNPAFLLSFSQASEVMAVSSLHAMESALQFNICSLETSYIPNVAVHDLSSRIKTFIPAYLLYACNFWADHIQDSLCQLDLLYKVKTFLYTQFLFWLEVLSIVRGVYHAHRALSYIVKWSEVSKQ